MGSPQPAARVVSGAQLLLVSQHAKHGPGGVAVGVQRGLGVVAVAVAVT